jgi:hypothetical protein
MLTFSISYPDMIKISYFADTIARGEEKVTYRITSLSSGYFLGPHFECCWCLLSHRLVLNEVGMQGMEFLCLIRELEDFLLVSPACLASNNSLRDNFMAPTGSAASVSPPIRCRMGVCMHVTVCFGVLGVLVSDLSHTIWFCVPLPHHRHPSLSPPPTWKLDGRSGLSIGNL